VHVRRRAPFQQYRAGSCHEVFLFLQGKMPKGIHSILREILGECAPSYATLKNWVTQFKRGDFYTCFAPHPERLKTVTTPEIIEPIHELIFEDRRISSKSIAEHPGISRDRVVSIIREDLDMRKFSAKWIPKCLNAELKRQPCRSCDQHLKLHSTGVIQMISCCDWCPCTNLCTSL